MTGDRHGTVAAFDAEVGLGEVAGEDGRRYPFHCVAIADGSRRIEEGTTVAFTVGPGLPGRWEAQDLRPAQPASPGDRRAAT